MFPSPVSATSLTLTIPATPLTLEVVPDGKVKTSSDSSISVKTDALSGYSLAIKAKDVGGSSAGSGNNGNALVNKTNPSFVIPSIPAGSKLDEAEYNSGDQYLNTWAFRPSKLEGSSNDKYLPAPTTTDPATIDKTTTSNSEEANSYSIAIAARLDSTIPAGAYTNTFIITASANATKYTINYHGNSESTGSSDVVDNVPDSKTDNILESSITISNQQPALTNFEFMGWCSVQTTNETCPNGTIYQPGDEWTLSAGDNTLDLYAMWDELLTTVIDATGQPITFKVGAGIEMIMVADSQTRQFNPPDVTTATTTKWWPYYAIQGTDVTMDADLGNKYLITVVPQKGYKLTEWQKDGNNWTAVGTLGSYQTMQTLTPDKCTKAGANGMNVTDTRNQVSYTVGIVSDGADFSRCWMYSNLRLEGGTSLIPENSDVSEKTSVATAVTADEWQNWYSKKEMIECKGIIGNYAKPPEVDPTSNRTCDANISTTTEFYYNWYSAIANDAVGDVPTDMNSATEDKDKQAKGSICPNNWRLLEEGTAGDHNIITDTTEIATLAAARNANQGNGSGRLALTGLFWSGLQHNVGIYGDWWSAARYNNAFSYFLGHSISDAYSSSNFKYNSRSVRCILQGDQ